MTVAVDVCNAVVEVDAGVALLSATHVQAGDVVVVAAVAAGCEDVVRFVANGKLWPVVDVILPPPLLLLLVNCDQASVEVAGVPNSLPLPLATAKSFTLCYVTTYLRSKYVTAYLYLTVIYTQLEYLGSRCPIHMDIDPQSRYIGT